MSTAVVDLREAAMTRFAYLSVLVLIPAQAYSQAEADSAGTALQGWSVEQLCDSRERRDVRDEMDRRDLFSSRDLRAIRNGEVKEGISLSTLICVRGLPASIVEAAGQLPVGPVAAYIYLPGEAEGLIAYVLESSAESTVVHALESNDPQAIVRNPNFVLYCITPSMTRCGLEDKAANRLPRNGLSYPGNICGGRACDADVRRSTFDTLPVSVIAPVPPGTE